jgi:hypothetical protein
VIQFKLTQILGGLVLDKLLAMFKKPLIGWVATLIMGAVAVAMNMKVEDVKSAVCAEGATKLESPAQALPTK